ncbi:caspase family protein, partial [Flavobacteriales bacterium]|nr:caspase family protein [Flavobacteriales bacterium]
GELFRVNSFNYDQFKDGILHVWISDGTYEQIEPYEYNNFEDLLNKFEKVSPTQYKNTFKQIAPANLKVTDLKFKDDNRNGLLEANEEALITFDVLNSGNGDAHNVKINIEWGNIVEGLSCSSPTDIYSIKSKQSKHVEIPIKGLDYLVSSEQNLTISITEANGFDADPFSISFNTEAFRPPNLEIVDYKFSSPSGVLKLASPLSLEFALQNLGMGVAENVSIKMILPTNVYPTDETEFSIKKLQPGETKVLKLDFFTNKRYSSKELNISVSVSEALNKYGFEKTLSEELNRSVDSDLSLKVRSTIDNEKLTSAVYSLSSKVDKNIPKNPKVKNRFALIIGNEDYTSYQSGLSTEQNVDYAVNDARVFKDYAINTLGIRKENLFHLSNATAGKMSSEIERITKLVKLKGEDAELIFYYAGHGFPDEETKIPYLIPVDVTVSDLSRAIKLSDIYHKFEETNAKRVTVFLDACFTGGSRNLGLLASRGVKIRPKQEEMNGNLIVFSASSEEQSALPFHREKHGIFTYHLLKKIQESQGNISYSDLFDYLQEMVQETSLRYNSKEQEPKVNTSPHIVNIWRDFKF